MRLAAGTGRRRLPDQQEAAVALFEALERILRPMLNGHGTGHDAVVKAKAALNMAHKSGLIERTPNLQCNCTPCANARRDGVSCKGGI